ncbi:hypothetical protein BDB01DRAFT_846535 [Pilobolus umbonatus]|nr:hypothetical protein BDB01DRAFT_846535 [Pilobolus umbonatus]
MREPNLCFPSQSRAAVCITSALYDRRALDCTATLPLVNSLTHLAYLTSTSPRIREILCLDGGLERLIRILSHASNRGDRLTLWKWTLAFQSIVNVGIRGTEHIRTKVVEAGVVPFVLSILGNFTKTEKKEEVKGSISTSSTSSKRLLLDKARRSSIDTTIHSTHSTPTNTISKLPSISPKIPLRRSTFPYVKIDPIQRRHKRIHKERQDSKLADIDNVFHREEDVLLSLQLLAYLSKYPHIRDLFYTAYESNVFTVVERFCHRGHPGPIQYWASVIMRNACRKDELRGGIRRCANMTCGKWEVQPREFAKCRRCRKAKYCSKACQSKAWADGHRWWCVEKPMTRDSSTANTTATYSTTTTTTDTLHVTRPQTTNDNGTVLVNDLTHNTSGEMGIIEQELTTEHNSSTSVDTDNRPMLMIEL